MVEKTGVPGVNHHQTSGHWQLSHLPWVGFEPAVSGNALDHTAILNDDDENNYDTYNGMMIMVMMLKTIMIMMMIEMLKLP